MTSWLMRSIRQAPSTVPRTTSPSSRTVGDGIAGSSPPGPAAGVTEMSPTRVPPTSTAFTHTEKA